MSGVPNPFAGPNPALVDAIALEIGVGFKSGYSPIALRHIADPRVGADTLMAAIALAHATGLATAIRTAAGGNRRQLVADIAAWLDAEVAA